MILALSYIISPYILAFLSVTLTVEKFWIFLNKKVDFDLLFFFILILVFVLWMIARTLYHFHYKKNSTLKFSFREKIYIFIFLFFAIYLQFIFGNGLENCNYAFCQPAPEQFVNNFPLNQLPPLPQEPILEVQGQAPQANLQNQGQVPQGITELSNSRKQALFCPSFISSEFLKNTVQRF